MNVLFDIAYIVVVCNGSSFVGQFPSNPPKHFLFARANVRLLAKEKKTILR